MNKRLLIQFFAVSLFFLMSSPVLSDAAPRTKIVTLKEFTTITLDIVPDLGTRFVFPFVLDEESEYVPFTSKITNPVFVSTRDNGRNFFVITLPSPAEGGKLPNYLGNLFVNVAGYNITVLLRSTTKTSLHHTDVVFELGDEDRQKLVEKMVNERMAVIEANYQQKEKALNKRAHAMALKRLGGLILSGGKNSRVSEEIEFDLSDGSRVVLAINRLHKYNNFYIFTYEFGYDGVMDKDLKIRDVQLFGKKSNDETMELIPSVFSMNQRLSPGELTKGFLASDYEGLNEYLGFQIGVSTSLGNGELSW